MPYHRNDVDLPNIIGRTACARLCIALEYEASKADELITLSMKLSLRPWFPVGGDPWEANKRCKGDVILSEELLIKSYQEIAAAMAKATTMRRLELHTTPALATAIMRLSLVLPHGVMP